MTRARRTIRLDAGVEVDMLFTPHLYSYRGTAGATLDLPSDDVPEDDRLRATLSLYADVFYFAALNAWELDGHEGDAPFRRGDFHEWATTHPRDFAKVMAQCVEALTGKPLNASLAGAKGAEGENPRADAINAAEGEKSGKKKDSAKNGRKRRLFCWGK